MKKFIPYGIALVAVAALFLLVASAVKNKSKELDEHISLRQRDKIPYGYYAAYKLLPSLFPNALITTDRRAPGNWRSVSATDVNQAVVLAGIRFSADEEECRELLRFAQKGNHVFIIAHYLSYDAPTFFHLHRNEIFDDDGTFTGNLDTLNVQLTPPRYAINQYIYPGRRFASYFSTVDENRNVVLGRNERGYPNFIQYKAGQGSIYLHIAPLAFSNYFILHKNNIRYFEQAFSVLPSNISRVLWNEYYLVKPTQNEPQKSKPSWLHVLFRYPSLKWALLTSIGTLIPYVLLEMRRKQRIVPVIQPPKNESLDFIKTIGRLYYDKGDHYNLVKKMTNYFLEHIRSRFKLSTHQLDSEFIQAVHTKTGYPLAELKDIIDSIHYTEPARNINDGQLSRFYHQLETFYERT